MFTAPFHARAGTAAARLATLLAILTGSPAVDAAPSDARDAALGEIVVTGRQPATERVATVYQLDASDIDRRGARTLDEAIELLPGVNVRVGGNGSPRIDVRGYRTRHVKLLVNGVPFGNTFDGQFDPSLIPAESIARIKLTTGASSVLYGDGGVGAVINVITRQGGRGHEAGARAEAGEGGHHRLAGTYAWGDDETAVFASVGRLARNGFPLAHDFASSSLENGGLRENSDRERNNGYLNLYRRLTPALEFGGTLTFADGEYGAPGTVVDRPDDPFANRPRWQRTDDQQTLSGQLTLAWTPGGALSGRVWAYVNTLEEQTNRYSDPFTRTLDDVNVRGTFSDDADSSVAGGHAELSYEHPFGGELTIMVEGRRERFEQDCVTRDVPNLPDAPPAAPSVVPLAAATSATLDFNYLSTNNFGATNAAGMNETVASLSLTETPTGVDFSMTSLAAGNFFVAGGSGPAVPDAYLSRLYFMADPLLTIGGWNFVDDPASEASVGGAVSFAAPGGGDVVNNYAFRARVGWQRPGGGGGAADPFFDGDTALWRIDNATLEDLLGFEAASTGGRPNAFAALEIRQVDAAGFWGASDAPTGGPGGAAVYLVAPASAAALVGPAPLDPAPVVNVPPAGQSCGSGGDGSGGGTPTRFENVAFSLRPFTQARDLAIGSSAVELSFAPFARLDVVLGYARHWLGRDAGAAESFGSHSVGVSYALTDDLRLRTGFARKIRMPSVRQLYDAVSGDSGLVPERSTTWESGLAYGGIARLTLGLTVFRSDVRDFIERDAFTGTFANNQRYRLQGVELTGRRVLGRASSLAASYTYLDASNRSAGSLRDDLQYRPRHKLVVQGAHRLAGGAEISATAQHVGGEVYFSRQGAPRTGTLDPYTLVNLRASQPLTGGRVRLYVGVENVLDEHYEESVGLPQAGRFVYGGVEVRWF